jgi:hypothetical protein
MPRAKRSPAQPSTEPTASTAQPSGVQPLAPEGVSTGSSLPAGSASLAHRTVQPVISPPPRPIKQQLPEDVFAKYDAGMRTQAAALYRLLEKGPVHIEPAYPEVVTWMRGKGVRIKTRMTTEGSFYELESDIPVP